MISPVESARVSLNGGTTGRPELLFFSQPFLFPVDTGGKIRTVQLLRHLREAFDVTLVSNVDPSKDSAYIPEMQKLCTEFHGVPRIDVPKYTTAFYWRVLTRTASRYPVTVIADYSAALAAKLRGLLERRRYDVLVCDFLQPSLNLAGAPRTPALLFQHNVESVIVRRHWELATNPALKLFWWTQWRKMARYERDACRRFDGVATVSELDKLTLERDFGARNVFAIPTGVDTTFFQPGTAPPNENTLVFTGAMDWLPNEDAIIFFAEEILGRVRAIIPSVKLAVVGRNPSRRLLERMKRYPEVSVVGRVDDIRPLVHRHAVYIIPLRIGGGTRIKAYEAMAMAKPVVSTRVGVEGLPVRDGDHVVLADRPDDFAAAVVRLLKDTTARNALGSRARAYVETHASWRHAGAVLAEACRSVARG
jgi:glycosyltransferase involved in cell wall biosynthesis